MSDNQDALLALADRIDEANERPIVIHKGAATELRRIRALNAELVEALKQTTGAHESGLLMSARGLDKARAALAKAQGNIK